MSKIDDLRTINNCAYHKFLNDIEGRETEYPDAIVEAERAGIAAVVRALRDEFVMMGMRDFSSDFDIKKSRAWFNEILGAAGNEKVAEYTGGMNDLSVTPAAAPAPQANTVVLSQGYVNQIEQSRVEAHRNPAPAPCLWRVHHQTRNGPLYVSQCDGEWRHATSDPKCPSCGKKIFFPAAAPAPAVCVWKVYSDGLVQPSCRPEFKDEGATRHRTICPCCKAPIKFTEAK